MAIQDTSQLKQLEQGMETPEIEASQLNEQLLALQAVIMAMSSSRDLQAGLDIVTGEMARLLKVKRCLIFDWDRSADKLLVLAGYGSEETPAGKVYGLADYPLLKRVLLDRYARQVTVSQPDIDPTELAYMQTAKIRSLLRVPLIFQERVVGLAELADSRSERTFTGQEISLIQLLARQAAMAIDRAHLYAETERRALRQTVFQALDQAITTRSRLSEIYYVFARQANRLLGYDRMSISLQEGEEMHITYAVGVGEEVLPVGMTLPLKSSATGRVAVQGQPLLRHNIAADIRFVEDEPLVARGIQSSMLVPLRVKGEVIGIWNLGSRQVSAYSPDDLEIAQSMADQLAVAIENARLYDEIRQYFEELTTLNKISQAITSTTLDWQETLTIITNHTLRLLGVAAASVALYDEANGDLWFAVTSGGSADFVRGKRLKVGQGIVGWVVEHGEPLLVPDVSKDSRFSDQFDQASGFTTHSILCVPLQTKGQTIGAIEALNKDRAFNQNDLRLLSSLAASAAAAIENARLYKQAQQEIAERKRAEEALQNSLEQLEITYKQAMFYAQELKEEITERKRVEAALEEERALLAQRVAERTVDLRRVNEELARAFRLKDEFLASMSHELRTPLSAILGLAEVLKEGGYGPLEESQIKALGDIEESGRHLLALINDILDLSKIGAGKLELQMGLVSVATVCQASLRLIKGAARKKQIKVSSELDKTVTVLQADERRLKQILVNLLSNAVKFTPEGGAIGLEVVGDTTRQEVDFSVWDTGIGIASEDVSSLFAPFVQLDGRLSRQYPGTGLGLALVQRMIELHGGRVSVESEPGQGSRFTVSLPWISRTKTARLVKPVDLATSVKPKVPHVGQQSSPAAGAPVPTDQVAGRLGVSRTEPPLILLAEDDEKMAMLLTDYLLAKEYRVIVVQNGLEAVERVREAKPDVILMDIQMPEMDGLEAIRRIRTEAGPGTATIPIVTLTALAMSGDRERCLQAGANDYLSKPVKLKELIQVIESHLA